MKEEIFEHSNNKFTTELKKLNYVSGSSWLCCKCMAAGD
jgi:hypothetical protein